MTTMISALARQARICIVGGPVTQSFAFTGNRAFAALAGNVQKSETPVQHLTGAPPLRALLLDAAGTLLSPSEPAALVIQRYARSYGCTLSELEILKNFRIAYNAPWRESVCRYVGDARPFWHSIVRQSTGLDNAALSEEIYQYFGRPEAWIVTPGAKHALARLRDAGVKRAVVSNFDTRLRPILNGLGLSEYFDVIVVSAEVGAEKPNPVIFEAACEQLGLQPGEVVHVGDDRRNDIYGARDAGCYAWLWGLDVRSLDDLADRILLPDSDSLRMI